MSAATIDARGLKCPQPVLKLAIAARTTDKGARIVVQADCPDFPKDVRKWCQQQGKTLLSFQENQGVFRAEVLI